MTLSLFASGFFLVPPFPPPLPPQPRFLTKEPLLADYWEARDKGRFSEALVSLKLVQDQLVEGLAAGVPAGLSTYTDLATFAK